MRQGSTEKNITPPNLRTLPKSRREMSAAAKTQAFWGILPGVFSVSERDLCFLFVVPDGFSWSHGPVVLCSGDSVKFTGSSKSIFDGTRLGQVLPPPVPSKRLQQLFLSERALGDGSRIRSTPRDKKWLSTCYMDDSALPKIERV